MNQAPTKTAEYYTDPKNWLGPKRLPGEEWPDFWMRREHENRGAKAYLKGTIFWNSANLAPEYKNPKIPKSTEITGWTKVVKRGAYRNPDKKK
jgi:hypothetical protein